MVGNTIIEARAELAKVNNHSGIKVWLTVYFCNEGVGIPNGKITVLTGSKEQTAIASAIRELHSLLNPDVPSNTNLTSYKLEFLKSPRGKLVRANVDASVMGLIEECVNKAIQLLPSP
ncbi:MAG: hypothetical protein HYU30_03650 [Chloroflexi bacterium]|nr:hypothetical protein [Chloroflexota bacterium]